MVKILFSFLAVIALGYVSTPSAYALKPILNHLDDYHQDTSQWDPINDDTGDAAYWSSILNANYSGADVGGRTYTTGYVIIFPSANYGYVSPNFGIVCGGANSSELNVALTLFD